MIKFFKNPKGAIKNSEKWKFRLAQAVKSALVIALLMVVSFLFWYSLLTPDY
jgi:hypothetical protein